jgi:short-subunit dehydrogenase
MAHRHIAGLRTIVTGASSGIGRALVIELMRRGAFVVAVARRKERLRELAGSIDGSAERLRWLAGDVTRREDRLAAIELARGDFGGLDALVNNAGVGALGRFDQANEQRLRHVMEVNFFAPAEFTREALPLLRAGNKPLVVNVGSVLGHRAVPEKSEYCASKFALHGLSDALRIELQQDAIDVLLVSPSTTSSEFFEVAAGQATRRPGRRFGAMPADVVARRIADAMSAGRREIILPAGGKLLVWLDRLCPPLADWMLARWA